jgi:hypothetical protein
VPKTKSYDILALIGGVKYQQRPDFVKVEVKQSASHSMQTTRAMFL